MQFICMGIIGFMVSHESIDGHSFIPVKMHSLLGDLDKAEFGDMNMKCS